MDLVAYEDLESFRKPRASFDSSKSSSSSDPANNKRRYLILTYISDFDKTFYPLPLSYVGVQGKDKLFKQVYKLRDSLYNNANREMNKVNIFVVIFPQSFLEKNLELSTRMNAKQGRKGRRDVTLYIN